MCAYCLTVNITNTEYETIYRRATRITPLVCVIIRTLRVRVPSIDIKKVDKQLTHAMHVKDRHVNDTFIDKLTKWYQ